MQREHALFAFLETEYNEKFNDELEPFSLVVDWRETYALLDKLGWSVDVIHEDSRVPSGEVRVKSFHQEAGRFCVGQWFFFSRTADFGDAKFAAIESAADALKKEQFL